jgi:hypothetical protein
MSGEDAAERGSDLRVLTSAGSEPEAELIAALLAQAGITSVAQRTIGGPEWGASGARYIYVRASELERAREVLGSAASADEGPGERED